ncbi:predicted protein [Chaetoceros tenuissimus]|uniref:Uncharacterized protein n=1 Tax=Chaetoceros tenuissimus TaxID=426638 RepID=A0AAD3CEZ2_9STRA|nr:predicted protein [Chaetoceros tenuissimus]
MKFDDSDRDWCLTAESFESKAKLHMRPCASTENNYLLQWFFFDDIGRMRLSMKPEFCLRWSGKGPKSEKSWKSAKSGKKQPFFYTCDDGSAKYKFKFVDGNIQAVGYGRPDTAWYLGIRPGEKKYEALRLFKAENSRDLNESLGMWNA